MVFVTLTSDYGADSLYTAGVKGALLARMNDVSILDISHAVKPHDITQAGFLLKNVFREFPVGTIHLVCVAAATSGRFIAAKYEGHYFVSADNGIFSLLLDKDSEAEYFVLNESEVFRSGNFPEKHFFPSIAEAIRNGDLEKISQKGVPEVTWQPLNPVLEENQVRGNILFIDGYDNAITNITRSLFESKLEGRTSFAIFYRRKQRITRISEKYSDVKEGSELALFNENGYLEIAMNRGDAGQLLGLQLGGPVIIEFYD